VTPLTPFNSGLSKLEALPPDPQGGVGKERGEGEKRDGKKVRQR